jgi:hypothetical protein
MKVAGAPVCDSMSAFFGDSVGLDLLSHRLAADSRC